MDVKPRGRRVALPLGHIPWVLLFFRPGSYRVVSKVISTLLRCLSLEHVATPGERPPPKLEVSRQPPSPPAQNVARSRATPSALTPFYIFLFCNACLVLTYSQTCPEVKTSALDTVEKWEEVCRQTSIQAAFIRVAALWAEEVRHHSNKRA